MSARKKNITIIKNTFLCVGIMLLVLFTLYLEFEFSEVPFGWKTGLYFIMFTGIPLLTILPVCRNTKSSFKKRLTTIIAVLCSLMSVIFFIVGRTYIDRQQENYLRNDDEYTQAARIVLPESLDEWGQPKGYAYIRDGWYRKSIYIEYAYEKEEFLSAAKEINQKYEFVSKGSPGYTDTNAYEFESGQFFFRVVNLEELSQGKLTYPYTFVIGIDEVNCQIVYFFVRDRENFFGKVLIVPLIDDYLEMLN